MESVEPENRWMAVRTGRCWLIGAVVIFGRLPAPRVVLILRVVAGSLGRFSGPFGRFPNCSGGRVIVIPQFTHPKNVGISMFLYYATDIGNRPSGRKTARRIREPPEHQKPPEHLRNRPRGQEPPENRMNRPKASPYCRDPTGSPGWLENKAIEADAVVQVDAVGGGTRASKRQWGVRIRNPHAPLHGRCLMRVLSSAPRAPTGQLCTTWKMCATSAHGASETKLSQLHAKSRPVSSSRICAPHCGSTSNSGISKCTMA
ncbi:hypothetical protein BLEM_0248 [Bifidobacterium lemurum]|uniref:Uncharacterized protein n=1 Tax=Bifidobacterium lemurum TaxID=1603886 RepID=A0A261FVL6_9BIFI|nr:hypothetical protein BLEM_0248 [Bifidobacterium lemurum]